MDMVKPTVTPARRWYREPALLALLLGPLVVVVASFITLALAARSDDGVVVDDYYKQGLAINRTLDRDRAAARLHYQAELHIPAAHSRVILRLHGPHPLPDVLNLRLAHPTRAGMDQAVTLHRTPDGTYAGSLEPLPPAHWEVKLEDPGRQWRLTGTWLSAEETEVHLGAAADRAAGQERLPE